MSNQLQYDTMIPVFKVMLHAIFLSALTIPVELKGEDRSLRAQLEFISRELDGRLGTCVLLSSESTPVCVRGDEKFPLQSVMKLIVGAAVFEAIDKGKIALNENVRITVADISPGPREFADQIAAKGSYMATIEELLRRSIIDSDSTSTDVLLLKLGGVSSVQKYLQRKGLTEIRVDRSERELQTESVGLPWRAEFVDLNVYEAAIKALPAAERDRAWQKNLLDPRDKATPRSMCKFLNDLSSGKLLSAQSTEKLLAIMAQVATGKDRLRAGVPPGWTVAHKTGTGRAWNGVRETVNDVGIITSPWAEKIIVVVFLSESRMSDAQQAAAIARVAMAASTLIEPAGSLRP